MSRVLAPWLGWILSSPGREAGMAAVLGLILVVAGSARAPVTGRDEARFAQAAREMEAAGEWVVPTFGGAPRYHKPIGIYWCTVASYKVFGVSAGAARVPSHLAAAVVLGLLAWSARRRAGPGAGLLAAALLLATPVFHLQARACTADMVMMLSIVVSMVALESLVAGSGGTMSAVAMWAALGVSVLAKGPVGPGVVAATGIAWWALGRRWSWRACTAGPVVLAIGWLGAGPLVLAVPAVVMVADLLRSGRLGIWWRRLRMTWGPLLAVGIVAPWAVAAWLATDGEFLRVAIGRHVVERSLSPFEGHGGFPGFYLVTALIVAFPWCAFLPLAIRSRWPRLAPHDRFLVAWAVGWLVVVELVRTKLVHYWMPSYPAAVLLVVVWVWTRPRGEAIPRAVRIAAAVGGGVLAAVPIVVAFRLGFAWLPGVVTGAAFAVAAAALSLGGTSARRRLTVAAAASVVALGLLVGWMLPALGPRLLPRQIADRVAAERWPGETVAVYRLRDDELLFELPLDTEVIRGDAELQDRLRDGPPILIVARAAAARHLEDQANLPAMHEVARVHGIDLGRVSYADAVLLRTKGG